MRLAFSLFAVVLALTPLGCGSGSSAVDARASNSGDTSGPQRGGNTNPVVEDAAEPSIDTRDVADATGSADATDSGGRTKSPLGAPCTSKDACASGHCVDSVCCDSACDGVCEQCNASGACVMPATDSACAPVSCPTSTTCKSYPAALTTNLCKARGTCKTAADCPATYTPARTPCAGTAPNQRLCDGAGSCKQSTVNCGGNGCFTNPGRCEIGAEAYNASASSTQCTTAITGGCAGDPKYCITIGCDEPSDCPTGSVCCWRRAMGQDSYCTLATECVGSAASSAYVMCDPSSGNTDCPTGQTCSGNFADTPPLGTYGAGYHYCKK